MRVQQSTGIRRRQQLRIEGAVQGVGFRPFAARLAQELAVTGWVRNNAAGAEVQIEATPDRLKQFTQRLVSELPQPARIRNIAIVELKSRGDHSFQILQSRKGDQRRVSLLPDLALCSACRNELFDAGDRRFRYPFISCCECGPRYSITRQWPFDRDHTSLAEFPMCDECAAEYRSPTDRRFHAQTIACPHCGPQLELWDRSGSDIEHRNEAIRASIHALNHGKIVAVLGVGGFQLAVDAANPEAVERLRERKLRPDQPLAVMFPTLDDVTAACLVSDPARDVLTSPVAPIALLEKRSITGSSIAANVSPENPYLGCFLPSSPLHAILLRDFGRPLVMTSGNRSGEAICYTDRDARKRLLPIADFVLTHDRTVQQPVDDSVVHLVCDEPMVLRRARGYVPSSMTSLPAGPPVLAVGAHQKNSIAVSTDSESCLGPYIGDLDSVTTVQAHERSIDQWLRWYDLAPAQVACDLHPDYLSTSLAQSRTQELTFVQHHYAHVLSCIAEHDLRGPVLGVCWDGVGLGSDGVLWGGEFLRVDAQGFQRAAHFRPFALPGGDRAAREPRRSALGILYAMFGDACLQNAPSGWCPWPDQLDASKLVGLLARSIASPWTTSVGRYFDAVASLLGLRHVCTFEGQAAMAVEFPAVANDGVKPLPFALTPSGTIDWGPATLDLLQRHREHEPISDLAWALHQGLADLVVAVSGRVGLKQVVLSGGCFQNVQLLEQCIKSLKRAGHTPIWHRQIPSNDGGLALGQLLAARRHPERKWHVPGDSRKTAESQ